MFSIKIKCMLIGVIVLVALVFSGYAYASEIFNVDPYYDEQGRQKINASLRYDGQNAHWYISDSYWVGLSSAQKTNLLRDVRNLSEEFDTVIYPRLRAVFGSENKPGVDDDPKISILLSRLIDDAGGYFREQDGWPLGEVTNSNKREMMYLNIWHISNSRMRSFLAHEFQHLITFSQKTVRYGIAEDVWLNELRSEIASTLLGYDNPSEYQGSNLEARVRSFLKDPVDSITNWQNEPEDYAVINLFGQYILDHYGRSVLASMISNERTGIDSFNAALRSFGFKEDFSDIVTNWSVAVLVNDCSLNVKKFYCYKNSILDYSNLHIEFSGVDAAGIDKIEQERSSMEWEATWFEIAKKLQKERPEKNIMRLEFSSPINSGFRVPYIVYDKNGIRAIEIKEMSLYQGKGEFFVEDFGFLVPKVVIIPSNQYGISGSTGKDTPKTTYDFTATLINKSQRMLLSPTEVLDANSNNEEIVALPNLPDGTLIRVSSDYKVYIIKGGYKRWMQTSEIFDFYGHLNFDAVRTVTPQELALYKDSWLVRAEGDEKVYEINGDGTRHWLDISSEKFTQTGRLWDMVYVINKSEIEWYKEGLSVK